MNKIDFIKNKKYDIYELIDSIEEIGIKDTVKKFNIHVSYLYTILLKYRKESNDQVLLAIIKDKLLRFTLEANNLNLLLKASNIVKNLKDYETDKTVVDLDSLLKKIDSL